MPRLSIKDRYHHHNILTKIKYYLEGGSGIEKLAKTGNFESESAEKRKNIGRIVYRLLMEIKKDIDKELLKDPELIQWYAELVEAYEAKYVKAKKPI